MKKKTFALGLCAAALSMSVMAGCGKADSADGNADNSFSIEYPSYMKTYDLTEPLTLDAYPETIVSLSTYPVPTLLEMDVKLAAVPATKVIEYPADFEGVILPGVMAGFDIEQVVSLDPDLVIMPISYQEQYGATLEEVKIPVYYVAMTSTETDVYNVIKEQAEVLVDAFSVDEEATKKGEAILKRFDELEHKLTEAKKTLESKRVLAITVAGETSIYVNSASSTLGCMLDKCGLENVFVPSGDATTGHSMNELDLEAALSYNPDVICITGSSTLEDNKALMDAIYAANSEYWDSIEAYKNGKVVYLPSSYVSTAGITILTNIENLAGMIEALYQ
ncbi:MAG: ABC transporter substrate-binding protein [Lachnospiraceae bacterium]|nr:ABC transporter substrate-binding protein [Lachnospiraceae bacterium]